MTTITSSGRSALLYELEQQRQRAEDWRTRHNRLLSYVKAHLYSVTTDEDFGADEILWGRAGILPTCEHGHTMTDAVKRGDGSRRCRTCHRESANARRNERNGWKVAA